MTVQTHTTRKHASGVGGELGVMGDHTALLMTYHRANSAASDLTALVEGMGTG